MLHDLIWRFVYRALYKDHYGLLPVNYRTLVSPLHS